MDESNHKIEPLQDYGARRWDKDWYKYYELPQLEYVLEVARWLVPDYDPTDDSYSPFPLAVADFAERYINSKLTLDERYEREIENNKNFHVCKDDYIMRIKSEQKLDVSFERKYLEAEELQDTIAAFNLDVSKFWYLLVFIKDYIEDRMTDAPTLDTSTFEDYDNFLVAMEEATEIRINGCNRKKYSTNNKDTLELIKRALSHYAQTYNNLLNENPKDLKEKLNELGGRIMSIGIGNVNTINHDIKETKDISYKKVMFSRIIQRFLKSRKAIIPKNTPYKISKDKMLFTSRLIYIVGYASEYYYKATDKDGKSNTSLSNLLRKYNNLKLDKLAGRIYH